MSNAVDALLAEAMKLSPEDRAELIDRLVPTLLPHEPLHPEWQAEIARRVADMDAGRDLGIPAEEAMAQLRAHILSRRPRP
ncbi:MAG: hypothetical protein RJA98_3458 [Pseudomonadota bacterium]|jgi:putative addiction module component (TIGR02574 family)